MNESIRYAWYGVVVAFLVLIGAASYVQVIGADDLRSHEANSRELYKQFGGPRGTDSGGWRTDCRIRAQ